MISVALSKEYDAGERKHKEEYALHINGLTLEQAHRLITLALNIHRETTDEQQAQAGRDLGSL